MNLSGFSAVGPGMQQGQINIADLKQKALQIQQAQMAVDAQKRELAGQAALFQGMPQGAQPPGNATPGMPPPQQMGQQPQPMPPGQSSMPMTSPTQGMPPPQMRPGQMPPPVQGPGVAPALPGGAQPQMPQGGGQQPQPGQTPGSDALSPQGQLQIIAQIAQSIKQRSPGIDPQTLFEAVKQQIALMGALSNTQKQSLTLMTDQIRQQTTERGQDVGASNTDKRVGATERGQDINADTQRQRTAAMVQNTNARIADADNRLNQTQAAINARQDKSLAGRAATKVQTERLSVLRAQVAQAKQKLSEANASMDPTKITAAQQAVDGALAQVTQFQQKVVGGAGAGGPPAGGGGQRGPSPASLNGKPIWPSPNGKSWVYEDGSEAK